MCQWNIIVRLKPLPGPSCLHSLEATHSGLLQCFLPGGFVCLPSLRYTNAFDHMEVFRVLFHSWAYWSSQGVFSLVNVVGKTARMLAVSTPSNRSSNTSCIIAVDHIACGCTSILYPPFQALWRRAPFTQCSMQVHLHAMRMATSTGLELPLTAATCVRTHASLLPGKKIQTTSRRAFCGWAPTARFTSTCRCFSHWEVTHARPRTILKIDVISREENKVRPVYPLCLVSSIACRYPEP